MSGGLRERDFASVDHSVDDSSREGRKRRRLLSSGSFEQQHSNINSPAVVTTSTDRGLVPHIERNVQASNSSAPSHGSKSSLTGQPAPSADAAVASGSGVIYRGRRFQPGTMTRAHSQYLLSESQNHNQQTLKNEWAHAMRERPKALRVTQFEYYRHEGCSFINATWAPSVEGWRIYISRR